MFRYGQGTDYFTYKFIYNRYAIEFDSFKFYFQGVEPGYSLLNIVFNKLHLSFETFVGVLSGVNLVVLFSVIKKNSSNLLFSLLIFFLNYYVPYLTNQWRQAFAMILALAILCSYINDGKKVSFIAKVVLVGFTFHFSILALLLVPLFDKLFSEKFIFSPIKPFIFCIFCFAFSFGSFLVLPVVFNVLHLQIVSKLISYAKSSGFSVLSVALRLLFGVLIAALSRKAVKESGDVVIKKIYRIYFYGLFLYLVLSQIAIFSRFSDYYTFMEVLLVPNIIYRKNLQKKKSRNVLKIAVLALYFVLFFKDLTDATYQGGYQNHGALHYPYVTIFNKDSIYEYREVPKIW